MDRATVRLGICADDFGRSRQVDDAVVDLGWHGRISATSCLVDGPSFGAQAGTLARLRDAGRLDVGLHLNLTEPFGDGAPRWPLPQLVGRAFARRLCRATLQREIRRQLDRFSEVLGFAPDHVDGHQHVHQLPLVRQLLLQELERRPGPRPWVRDSGPRRASFGGGLSAGERCRMALIGLLGAAGLRRQLALRGFASNGRLLGLYRSRCSIEQYLQCLQCWLAGAREGDLLMCHPAAPPRHDLAGAVGGNAEYRVLASSRLPGVLAAHRVQVARISQLVHAGAGSA